MFGDLRLIIASNRVVILQFANMDALKAWRQEGEADLESNVGNEYASFRVYAVEGVAQWAALPAYRIAEFMSSFLSCYATVPQSWRVATGARHTPRCAVPDRHAVPTRWIVVDAAVAQSMPSRMALRIGALLWMTLPHMHCLCGDLHRSVNARLTRDEARLVAGAVVVRSLCGL